MREKQGNIKKITWDDEGRRGINKPRASGFLKNFFVL